MAADIPKRYLLRGGVFEDNDYNDEPFEGDDPRYCMTVDGHRIARDPRNNLHVLSWCIDGVGARWAVVESTEPLGVPLTDGQFRYRCRIARGEHTDG